MKIICRVCFSHWSSIDVCQMQTGNWIFPFSWDIFPSSRIFSWHFSKRDKTGHAREKLLSLCQRPSCVWLRSIDIRHCFSFNFLSCLKKAKTFIFKHFIVWNLKHLAHFFQVSWCWPWWSAASWSSGSKKETRTFSTRPGEGKRAAIPFKNYFTRWK